jgi:hypothetical protein
VAVRRIQAKEGVERDGGGVVPRRRHSSLGRASQVGVIKPRTNRSVIYPLVNKSLVLPEKMPIDKQRPPTMPI